MICSCSNKHWTRSKTHYTETNFYYLDEVDTLDDVDTDDDVDTELDVETLKWKQVVVMKIHVLWIDTAMIWLPERSNIPLGSYIAKLSTNLYIFVVKIMSLNVHLPYTFHRGDL